MPFHPVTLNRPIQVDRVVTVHYFEYSSDYYFEGECHDFWEFLYVDKGELDVLAGDRKLRLVRGQFIFHAPGEFHALRATGTSAPNLMVVSFYCDGPDMARFVGRVDTAGDPERALMARIVEEGSAAFSTPLDDPTTTAMERSPDAPFGAEQLLGAAIEGLLISLLRRDGAAPPPPASLIRTRGREELFVKVTDYLRANLGRSLTLEEVCRDNLVGRSRLQQIFREHTGGGAMEFFGKLKIERAKEMIREGSRNFTEIAAALGYQSIYYFSRHFKKVTGMTPSEYASSVKILAGKTRPGGGGR